MFHFNIDNEEIMSGYLFSLLTHIHIVVPSLRDQVKTGPRKDAMFISPGQEEEEEENDMQDEEGNFSILTYLMLQLHLLLIVVRKINNEWKN